MITEIALLNIKPELIITFESDFIKASAFISKIDGYISHSLKKCIEEENKYLLTVYWETLESHTVGFRTSEAYVSWKKILHFYYHPFPVVEHYETVFEQN